MSFLPYIIMFCLPPLVLNIYYEAFLFCVLRYFFLCNRMYGTVFGRSFA